MTQIPNITAQQTEHDVGQQQKRLWAPEEWLKDTTQPAGPWILSKTERLTPTSNVAASTTSHLQPHDDKPNVAIQSSGHMFCDVTTPSPSLPPPAGCWDAECCGCTIWSFDKWLSLRTEPPPPSPPSQECWWLTGLLEDPPFSHAACCSSSAQTMPLTSFTFCRFQTDFQPLKYYSVSSAALRSLGE